jgi:hypothetical protein
MACKTAIGTGLFATEELASAMFGKGPQTL